MNSLDFNALDHQVRILVVDDDPSFNELVSNFLKRQKFSITSVSSSKSALKELVGGQFDLVLADYQLPGMNGLELIDEIKSTYSDLPIILITNYADIRVAVDSIKLGAFEFVNKPVIPDELLRIIHLALTSSAQTEPTKEKAERMDDYVVGENAKTSQLWKHLMMVSPTKMNVLIIGESGTGKEHISRTIHKMSRRRDGPFVSVDCGALSVELAGSELFGHVKGAFTGANVEKRGLFEEANGGTLFLDEAGNLPYEIQALLLRAIQEGVIKKVGGNTEIKVDVRLLAATNEVLGKNVEDGTFRNDLYHRLNEFELRVPPLRDRFDDLEEFCAFFIEQATAELEKPPMTISSEALDIFRGYHWPGNLRELRNIIRRAVLLASEDQITADILPPLSIGTSETQPATHQSIDQPQPEGLSIKEQNRNQERQLIVDALTKFKFNKTKAANALNIDRSTLYYKIKQYDIDC